METISIKCWEIFKELKITDVKNRTSLKYLLKRKSNGFMVVIYKYSLLFPNMVKFFLLCLYISNKRSSWLNFSASILFLVDSTNDNDKHNTSFRRF